MRRADPQATLRCHVKINTRFTIISPRYYSVRLHLSPPLIGSLNILRNRRGKSEKLLWNALYQSSINSSRWMMSIRVCLLFAFISVVRKRKDFFSFYLKGNQLEPLGCLWTRRSIGQRPSCEVLLDIQTKWLRHQLETRWKHEVDPHFNLQIYGKGQEREGWKKRVFFSAVYVFFLKQKTVER